MWSVLGAKSYQLAKRIHHTFLQKHPNFCFCFCKNSQSFPSGRLTAACLTCQSFLFGAWKNEGHKLSCVPRWLEEGPKRLKTEGNVDAVGSRVIPEDLQQQK